MNIWHLIVIDLLLTLNKNSEGRNILDIFGLPKGCVWHNEFDWVLNEIFLEPLLWTKNCFVQNLCCETRWHIHCETLSTVSEFAACVECVNRLDSSSTLPDFQVSRFQSRDCTTIGCTLGENYRFWVSVLKCFISFSGSLLKFCSKLGTDIRGRWLMILQLAPIFIY